MSLLNCQSSGIGDGIVRVCNHDSSIIADASGPTCYATSTVLVLLQAIDNLHKGLTALHSLTQHTWSGLQASRCSAEAQLLLRAISIAQSGALPDDAAFGADDASVHKAATGKPVELRAVSAPAAAAGVEMAQRAQQSALQPVQQQEVQQEQQGEQQQNAGVPLDSSAGDGAGKMGEAEQRAQASPFWAYANASMERTSKSGEHMRQ